jgi:hypothetical protein
MRFTDAQLQKCYDQNFAEAKADSNPLRRIHALMGVYDWFQMLEGQHSSRVHEVPPLCNAEPVIVPPHAPRNRDDCDTR